MSGDLGTEADWCIDTGSLAICGTRMREHSRRSEGDRWCFHCRKRHEFFAVFMVPDGPSWYDPHWSIDGIGDRCTDLFPGWSRTWEDE
jgi:hypothetical protein